jgi:hypothetical protein
MSSGAFAQIAVFTPGNTFDICIEGHNQNFCFFTHEVTSHYQTLSNEIQFSFPIRTVQAVDTNRLPLIFHDIFHSDIHPNVRIVIPIKQQEAGGFTLQEQETLEANALILLSGIRLSMPVSISYHTLEDHILFSFSTTFNFKKLGFIIPRTFENDLTGNITFKITEGKWRIIRY